MAMRLGIVVSTRKIRPFFPNVAANDSQNDSQNDPQNDPQNEKMVKIAKMASARSRIKIRSSRTRHRRLYSATRNRSRSVKYPAHAVCRF
jgi:hypothetical protein